MNGGLLTRAMKTSGWRRKLLSGGEATVSGSGEPKILAAPYRKLLASTVGNARRNGVLRSLALRLSCRECA